MELQVLRPGLYLVATPLGNLGDLSPRAREIISRASFLAAESSQVAMRWLNILEKDAPEAWQRPGLLSYRESSREQDAQRILEKVREGGSVALISDAGTPAVSDPGWHLVHLAWQAELEVWPVPGPCAAVAALSASGFPSRRFRFEGFLPSSGRQRREALQRLQESSEPVILYESPHRFLETLGQLAQEMPEREIFVSREMTKKFEENWRGRLVDAVDLWEQKMVKGEFTLVLAAAEEQSDGVQEHEVSQETIQLIRELNLPTKTATALIRHFLPKSSKKAVYQQLLAKQP